MPPYRCSDDMAVEQLILPVQCRHGVLQLAHTIPLAGRLGKDSTAPASITVVLLADNLQRCRGLLSQLQNLPKIVLSTWYTSTNNTFASVIKTIQTHCNGYHRATTLHSLG